MQAAEAFISKPFPIMLVLLLSAAAAAGGEFSSFETRYYTLHTDLPPEQAREAAIRMTKMAEEYIRRTRGFSGSLRQRMPFYLYSNADDFHAAGGMSGSSGYFNGRELVAFAGEIGPRTWFTVQHEGFHQFARLVIRGQLPTWTNEGLAEYFGEAVFTGDGFISGVIPQWRLARIRERFEKQQFRPLEEMMNLSRRQWNEELASANYDQAWSMVQFLAHGEQGKYQRAFAGFMQQLSAGRAWEEAWRDNFGEIKGFEEKWRRHWMSLADHPTDDLYAHANLATLTSFLGRAVSRRQAFSSIDDFKRAAGAKQLNAHPDDWLPHSLLNEALWENDRLMKSGYVFTIVPSENQRPARITCVTPGGIEFIGTFAIRNGKVSSVKVTAPATPSTNPRR